MIKPDYERDGVRLYLADCLDVLPELTGVDLLLTDPPYGIGYGGVRNSVGGTEGRARNGWRTWETTWDESPAQQTTIDAALAACRDGIIWGGNYFRLPPSQGWLVWDKGQREFSLADAELAWTSRDNAVRCFTYSRAQARREERVHPTQKPLPLMDWCLSHFPAVKSVLDPFMGSGTTGVACIQTGRNFIGIEKDPTYFAIAVKRIEAALNADRDSLWTAKQLAEQQRELFTEQP